MSSVTTTIVPHLWFDREAVEAAELYVSVFPDSRVIDVVRLEHTPSGAVDIVSFELLGQRFEALNAGPLAAFNEAVSFMVKCDTQGEVDRYWAALTGDGGEEGDCGWLKDRYGLSWQIIPRAMDTLLRTDDTDAKRRVTESFLTMRKLDIAALERAARGTPR